MKITKKELTELALQKLKKAITEENMDKIATYSELLKNIKYIVRD